MSGLDIQLEKSKYDSPVRKKNWSQVSKYDESYTVFSLQLIQTNGSVVSCSEKGDMGSIPGEC